MFRNIIFTLSFTFFSLFFSACNGPLDLFAKDPKLAFACLKPLNHEGPLLDIETNYRAKAHHDKQELCEENQIFVAEKAGTYDFRIPIEARNGEIRGMAEIDLVEKGNNGTIESWLIGSPCILENRAIDQTGNIFHLESALGISQKNNCFVANVPNYERRFTFRDVLCNRNTDGGEPELEKCSTGEIFYDLEDGTHGRYRGNEGAPVWLRPEIRALGEKEIYVVIRLDYLGPDPTAGEPEPGLKPEENWQVIHVPLTLQPTG